MADGPVEVDVEGNDEDYEREEFQDGGTVDASFNDEGEGHYKKEIQKLRVHETANDPVFFFLPITKCSWDLLNPYTAGSYFCQHKMTQKSGK